MSVRNLNRSLAQAATTAAVTAGHCHATIGARLPIFFGYLLAPTPKALTEWNLAVSEKVEATLEGAFAAGVELQAALIRSAFSPPMPAAFADDMLKVIHKAGAPARKRVKANASRLNRKRPAA